MSTRVDLVMPTGQTESSILRDGEKVEVSREREGRPNVFIRIRRVSRGHIVVELGPDAEETPRERIKLVRPL